MIPSDIEAEADLLGAMMLNSEATKAGLALVEAEDFHSPTNGSIFAAIRNLHSGGQPVDTRTVFDALSTMPVESRPDVSHLVSMMTNVPSVGNAAEYAGIVAKHSAARSVIRLCSETINDIQRGSDPYKSTDGLTADLAQIDVPADQSKQEAMTIEEVIATSETDSPWVVEGMIRQDWRSLLVASEGIGKALALDTPIATPDGWTTMGDIRRGDVVFDETGVKTRVIAVTEVMEGRPCFDVRFSDGSSIIADASHMWVVVPYDGRSNGRWERSVVTTADMADTVNARQGFTRNYAIETGGPIECDEADLPIDPYVLGAWLSDVATRYVASIDLPHVAPILQFHTELRHAGLLSNKHIPVEYLRAAPWQRLAVLQGLMDTDGSVGLGGDGIGRGFGAATCEFTNTNKRLASEVHELVTSLGIKSTINQGKAKLNRRVIGDKWRVTFQTNLPVFRLARKAALLTPLRTHRSLVRYVENVAPVESVPVRCIQVEADSGCFLAGRSMIPTHNSVILRQVAMLAAQGIHPFKFNRIPPVRTLIVDLENPAAAIVETGGRMARQLALQLGGDHDPTRCRIFRRPGGIDPRTRHDRGDLEREIIMQRPDLVCIGPAYKMLHRRAQRGGTETHEEATDPVLEILDDLRTRHRFGLMIEHHAPQGYGGSRDLRPYGSQRWMAWPEIGLTLSKSKTEGRVWNLGRFRGDRLASNWPSELSHGTVWPWEGTWKTGQEREAF